MKKFLLITVVLLICNHSFAQWTTSGNNIYNSNTGSVGIGTTIPGALLSLGSSTNQSKFAVYENGNYQWGFGVITQQFETYFASDNTANHFSWGSMSFDGNHTFTEFMRLNATGNLLVGKTSQTNTAYMLDVAGNARVNSITVNTTGADFVFKQGYKLYSLPALKNYINQNHHLPGIASAKVMQSQGLDIGENQTKLLQKIEELTLYTIASDKQITQQQETMDKQNKLLTDMATTLANQQKEIRQLQAKIKK